MAHIYGGNAEYPEPFIGRAFQNKPEGYAPEMDEDDGTMSGWYMFAQLGFYPLNIGTSEYELFSPLFKKVVLRTGGHRLVIKASGRKDYSDPVKEILIDGKKLQSRDMDHKVFQKDSKITFKY